MGALNALLKTSSKALTKAGTKTAEKAVGKAIEKTTEKALTKAITNAAEKTAIKTVNKALTKGGVSTSSAALSKLVKGASLAGETGGKLSTRSGSTLEGVLGKSSGIKLPNAKKKTLQDYGENSVGSLIGEDITPADLREAGISTNTIKKIKNAANEGAALKRDAFEAQNAFGITSKSKLPKLNREQYYSDTMGSVRNGQMSFKDVPSYMNSHLSNDVDTKLGNDSILREFFGDTDNQMDLNELYDKYDKLAQAENSNITFTGDNIDKGLMLGDKNEKKAIEQEIADVIYGNKKDIKISGGSSRDKKINVERPSANLGEASTITDTSGAGVNSEEALREEIANLRSKIGAGGYSGSGNGGNGGGNTASAAPDFGGLGDSGFNVKLKNGETTNVQLGRTSVGSTPEQKYARKRDDNTAKKFNPTNKQYADIIGKSKSIDNHYKTVTERMKAEHLDQANIADKSQAAISGRENIKQVKGLQYAEANGVTMDLSNIDNSIGMSATQKRKLSELGLGLDDMLGGNSVVTPTQAEDIYKTLRDYAYNWSDSKDALTSMAGKAMGKEAEAVRNIIDDTMDNINVDYKTPLVEFMAQNGEDPDYIRKIAAKTDFKFSDLRKDQSDWLTMQKVAGNKIKENPTLNVFGVDTGIENPFTAGAEKIKEKIYEKRAYGNTGGAGFGGNGSSTGTAGAGASGAENNINFNTAPAGKSKLQSLLSKGKDAGLVGAGVLGGLLLGGGGNDNSNTSSGTLGDMLNSQSNTSEVSDPYSTVTLGGYTYDQLEQGYAAAMSAGDTNAASVIKDMMDTLEAKIERTYGSASSSSSSSNSKSALNVLTELYNLYGDIKGGTGPISGNITNALNTITGGGYNTEANTYWQTAQGALGKIIKGMGDTGALSEGDQQRALKMIPNITDTTEAAEAKFKALYQILMQASS